MQHIIYENITPQTKMKFNPNQSCCNINNSPQYDISLDTLPKLACAAFDCQTGSSIICDNGLRLEEGL